MNSPSKLFLVVTVWLALTLPAYASTLSIDDDLKKLLALPESKIDVGIAALIFAKEIYPDIDIEAYSRKIDVLASKVRQLANGTQSPERRIRVLNTVLYRNEGFHYDRAPFSRSKQEYYFLNGILDSKQGICYTLPLLYLAVAQRAGYPVYPVAAPDHMFVRYTDSSLKEQNIEATSGGKFFTDDSYIEDFSIGKQGLKSGAYLKTMTYRELLGVLLGANAFILARNGNGGRAIAYLEKAVRLHPKCADCYDNLSIGYAAMSKSTQGKMAQRYEEKSRKYALRAQQLGFIDPSQVNRGREVRGK